MLKADIKKVNSKRKMELYPTLIEFQSIFITAEISNIFGILKFLIQFFLTFLP